MAPAILGLVLGVVYPTFAPAIPLHVAVDTTALAGTSAKLAFDLIDGDSVPNNSATISGFQAMGATLGGPTIMGGVSGSLPGVVVIADTDFQNTLEQDIVLGTAFAFVLDVTSNLDPAGSVPDSFAFFILNSTGVPIVATDLPADALIIIDIGTPAGTLSVATSTTPNVAVSVTQQAPEPDTLLLMLAPLSFFSLRYLRPVTNRPGMHKN